jgi:hypothetical protein
VKTLFFSSSFLHPFHHPFPPFSSFAFWSDVFQEEFGGNETVQLGEEQRSRQEEARVEQLAHHSEHRSAHGDDLDHGLESGRYATLLPVAFYSTHSLFFSRLSV